MWAGLGWDVCGLALYLHARLTLTGTFSTLCGLLLDNQGVKLAAPPLQRHRHPLSHPLIHTGLKFCMNTGSTHTIETL